MQIHISSTRSITHPKEDHIKFLTFLLSPSSPPCVLSHFCVTFSGEEGGR
jgi:hypothetical protein